MKIIIHLGPHKTGSTYLQIALNQSREALLNQKIFYPAGDPGHHLLSHRIKEGMSDKHILSNEINTNNTDDYDYIVFSSENFINVPLSHLKDELSSLKNLGEIVFLFAYRDAHELGKSLLQEGIKHGASYSSIDCPWPEETWMKVLKCPDISPKYLQRLTLLAQELSIEPIYFKPSKQNPEIPIHCVSNLLGIKTDLLQKPVEASNSFLPVEGLALVEMMNNYFSNDKALLPLSRMKLSRAFSRFLKNQSANIYEKDMSERWIQHLRKRIAPPNSYVEKSKSLDEERISILMGNWQEFKSP